MEDQSRQYLINLQENSKVPSSKVSCSLRRSRQTLSSYTQSGKLGVSIGSSAHNEKGSNLQLGVSGDSEFIRHLTLAFALCPASSAAVHFLGFSCRLSAFVSAVDLVLSFLGFLGGGAVAKSSEE